MQPKIPNNHNIPLSRMSQYLTGGSPNPWLAFNSGSRNTMWSSQSQQYLTLHHGTYNQVTNGVDLDLGQSTWSVRAPCNLVVRRIVNRFKRKHGLSPKQLAYDIYYQEIRDDNRPGKHGYIHVPTHHSKHIKFGFLYKHTAVMKRILEEREGAIVRKDEILADSPAVMEDGNYNWGREASYAFMSDLGTHEDGVIMREGARADWATTSIHEITFTIQQGDTLLDKYGNEEHGFYKPWRDIGEVCEDGVFAVKRSYNATNYFARMSTSALSKADRMVDEVIHCPVGARVVNIEVLRNTMARRINVPDRLSQFLDEYHDMTMDRLDAAADYYHEAHRRDGKNLRIDAELLNYASKKEQLKKETYGATNKRQVIDFYKRPIREYGIKVTFAKTVIPHYGYKFSGMHGDKFVVCAFWPDERMPVDQWGRRVDFIIDPRTLVARNNPGNSHELWLKDALFHTRLYLIEMLERGESYQAVFNELRRFAGLVSSPWQQLIDLIPQNASGAYNFDRNQYLAEALGLRFRYGQIDLTNVDKTLNTIRMYLTCDTDEIGPTAMRNLKGTPFYPKRGPVTYIDHFGNQITTAANIRISNKYLFMLEKDTSDCSGVSAPKRQSVGIAAKMSSHDKRIGQISNSPVRHYGEAEMRILFCILGPEIAARVLSETNNPVALRKQLRSIYTTKNPTAIRANHHNEEKQLSRGAEQLGHYHTVFGMEMTRA